MEVLLVALVILPWLILCWAVMAYADRIGRSGWGFFFISLILSPIIGFIIVAALGPDVVRMEKRQVMNRERRVCPRCAELVRTNAKICSHCGYDFKDVIAEEKTRLTDLLREGKNNVAIAKAMNLTPIAAGQLLLYHFGTKSTKEARGAIDA